ncbi:integrase catalytic domain-containing protein [Trichonephila clavipes]|nr:integrase catalytic domain-containing protein [Trichonephila clavipes]
MNNNATCHRTLAVQDCLDGEGIQRLVWPAQSPDLNPIENVWDALERQVAGRNYPPTNKNTFIRALTEEWDKLPQQLLDNVAKTSKAVVLEIVSDMTTDAFLDILKRFVARHGKCATISSDNAKNFVGANRELKRLHNLLKFPEEKLSSYLSSEGSCWNLMPPRAPNFGGLWEAGVK